MFLKSFLAIAAIVVLSLPALALPVTKKDQAVALQAALAELKTHYGLIKYKEQVLGISYDQLEQKYLGLIENAMTLEELHELQPRQKRDVLPPEEFRQLLVGLAAEFQDGHLNIRRNTAKGSTLGLEVAAFGNRLIITGYNPDFYVPSAVDVPLRDGDEILEINGRKVQDIAQENMLYAPRATFQSRLDTALEATVNLSHSIFRAKKEGELAQLKILRTDSQGNQFIINASFHWLTGTLDSNGFYHRPGDPKIPKDGQGPEQFVFGHKGMTRSYFSEGIKNLGFNHGALMDVGAIVNSDIKSKKFGSGKNSLKPVTRLSAYTVPFNNLRIGVIRVPNYSPEGGAAEMMNELEWIHQALNYMEYNTDGVILDLVSNNGGFVYYVSQLVRMFATEEIPGVTVDYKLTETLLKTFAGRAKAEAPEKNNVAISREAGMANFATVELSGLEMEILNDLYEKGVEWSGPRPFMGTTPSLEAGTPGKILAGGIRPYSKPVMVLNDGRSASGGDFGAAIFKQSGRAMLMGSTSMGLGAPVYRETPVLPGSEMSMRCPFGMCLRSDGLPIENVGVPVDVQRLPKPEDVKDGFTQFSMDVLSAAAAMIQGATAAQIQMALDKIHPRDIVTLPKSSPRKIRS